ncbi:class I SAM-dependent methyltransferase [Dyadobacter psychrotolerans]|uniref:Class I SAM-dependent methyltransferase n=1 Tax=Dyadobacter psychrotolerans TaxID=2541721 RepID=A0A4R5DQI0_9BACT|nr:class I SAM-dependent methyltransferase [Dyadobacter psychrotolerans]TDE16636.1 class I SAM-dependent methyltransferase [Dyadobacter psychrotolerans]
MKNNYDHIAGNYDWLSRVIFGRQLISSQTCLLQHIPAGSKILIAGGGTGWILEEISKIHSSGLSITYVEISQKMIQLAERRNTGQNQVNFINAAIEDFVTTKQYDIIFTAFLFDNFEEEKISLVFENLSRMLDRHGKWLFADFFIDKNQSSWWQKLLLKVMLIFFRIVSDIEASALTPTDPYFETGHFHKMFEYSHFSGFIRSYVYVRILK